VVFYVLLTLVDLGVRGLVVYVSGLFLASVGHVPLVMNFHVLDLGFFVLLLDVGFSDGVEVFQHIDQLRLLRLYVPLISEANEVHIQLPVLLPPLSAGINKGLFLLELIEVLV
jgi:hypothetical protein